MQQLRARYALGTTGKFYEEKRGSSNGVIKVIKKQTGKQSKNQEFENQHKGVTFMPYVKGVSD